MNSELTTVDVTTETIVGRPKEVVAAYEGDPANAPQWYANIASADLKTDPPLKVGSRIAFVAHFLRRRLDYTCEIVELVADERLVMRTAHGPVPMETSYAWEATEGGDTRMTLRNRGQPAGFSRLVAVLATAIAVARTVSHGFPARRSAAPRRVDWLARRRTRMVDRG